MFSICTKVLFAFAEEREEENKRGKQNQSNALLWNEGGGVGVGEGRGVWIDRLWKVQKKGLSSPRQHSLPAPPRPDTPPYNGAQFPSFHLENNQAEICLLTVQRSQKGVLKHSRANLCPLSQFIAQKVLVACWGADFSLQEFKRELWRENDYLRGDQDPTRCCGACSYESVSSYHTFLGS